MTSGTRGKQLDFWNTCPTTKLTFPTLNFETYPKECCHTFCLSKINVFDTFTLDLYIIYHRIGCLLMDGFYLYMKLCLADFETPGLYASQSIRYCYLFMSGYFCFQCCILDGKIITNMIYVCLNDWTHVHVFQEFISLSVINMIFEKFIQQHYNKNISVKSNFIESITSKLMLVYL
jgi:hypothetical protein